MKTILNFPNGVTIIVENEDVAAPQLLEVMRDSKDDDFQIKSDVVNDNFLLKEENKVLIKNIDSCNNEIDMLRGVITDWQKKAELLQKENKQLLELSLDWEKKNEELKTKINQLTAVPSPDNIVVNHKLLAQDHKSVSHERTVNTHSGSAKHLKGLRILKFAKRKCYKCGNMYQPNSPNGKTCPDCRAEKNADTEKPE